MKFLLIALGTRGDIEPFLAVGEMLANRGHNVTGVFPQQFEQITLDSSMEFIPMTAEFLDMIEGDVGKQALGGKGNFIQKFKAYYKLYKASKEINRTIFKQQFEAIEALQPDKIVHSIKATIPVHWGVDRPGKSIILSPIPCVIHPVKGRSSMAFRGKDLGKLLNKWSYQFTTYATVKNLRFYLTKLLHIEANNDQKTLKSAMQNEPAIFTVSPSLINTQGLPKQVAFLGYQERNKTRTWQPDEALKHFLEKNQKFIFLTFGSMSNPEPVQKTKVMMDIFEQLGIPAIINTAGGGLIEPSDYNKSQFYFTSNIPYDWILPKTHAIIHHGGSGTTHLGLKYSCASMIIPHIIDQFFWNNVLSDLGVGPKGIKIGSISQSNLEPLVNSLWTNIDFKQAASSIAQKMAKEDFQEELMQILEA